MTMPLVPASLRPFTARSMRWEKGTFHGYGPEQGYGFLKEALKGYYAQRGIELDGDEILFPTAPKAMWAIF